MHRNLLPRLGDILFASILAGSMLLGQRMLNVDSDLGRHLTVGGFILSSGSIPTHDILSYTRSGNPRPPYEWLAQVFLAGAHSLSGLDGVVLLIAAVVATAYTVAFADARSRTRSPLLALGFAVWAAGIGSVHWVTRPHVFTFLFLAIWLALLERLRQDRREALWQLPIVMLLWANSHGGFIVGFIAWAAYTVGILWDRRQSADLPRIGANWLLTGLLSLLASIATPDLWHNWSATLGNSSLYVLSRTAETVPPGLRRAAYWPFFVMVLTALALGFMSRRRLVAAHLILLLAFGALSLLVARNVPLFGLAAVPILATWAANALSKSPTLIRLESRLFEIEAGWNGIPWPLLSVVMAAMALGVLLQRTGENRYSYNSAIFPTDASTWIQQHTPPGNMFNDLNWGGYLLYRHWPDKRVFIDSQSDFYGEAFIRQYEAILGAAPGWQQLMDQNDVAWVLIRPQSALAATVADTNGWQEVFRDSTSVIFVRTR